MVFSFVITSFLPDPMISSRVSVTLALGTLNNVLDFFQVSLECE
jgi:hypothetical protein